MIGQFTPEEIEIIGKMKGYSPTVPNGPGEPEIPNKDSVDKFIQDVYEKMIKQDVKNVFLEYARMQRREAELAEEEAIMARVDVAITSTLE